MFHPSARLKVIVDLAYHRRWVFEAYRPGSHGAAGQFFLLISGVGIQGIALLSNLHHTDMDIIKRRVVHPLFLSILADEMAVWW